MPRPKSDDPAINRSIRLTASQWAVIDAAAKRAGVSRSEFFRRKFFPLSTTTATPTPAPANRLDRQDVTPIPKKVKQ